MSFVKNRTKEQQADVLSQYLPTDALHEGKNKSERSGFPYTFPITFGPQRSVLRKVLIGLAQEWIRLRDKLNEIEYEYNPEQTTQLIEEWETLVGIPDDCISNTGTLEQRRTNILLKLAGINATTAEQFITIAAVLGYVVTIETGVEEQTFPLTLPFYFSEPGEEAFVFIVNMPIEAQTDVLPLTLPFTLSDGVPDILDCLFNKLKPANTKVFFNFI